VGPDDDCPPGRSEFDGVGQQVGQDPGELFAIRKNPGSVLGDFEADLQVLLLGQRRKVGTDSFCQRSNR
jgi:hypothetical protein